MKKAWPFQIHSLSLKWNYRFNYKWIKSAPTFYNNVGSQIKLHTVKNEQGITQGYLF